MPKQLQLTKDTLYLGVRIPMTLNEDIIRVRNKLNFQDKTDVVRMALEKFCKQKLKGVKNGK